MIDTQPYHIAPGSLVDLRERPTREDGGLDKEEGKKALNNLLKRLVDLQELLYARQARGLLVIFQAMDAGGKDSTTRRVFRKLNPAGVRVKSFKSPSQRERLHDFLWRIHQHTPRRGYIAIFNRSQYEDVVAVRVRQLAPPEAWQRRFEHINAFEHLLADEGTIVLKFFLHISKDYQKERLQRRLDRPDKHWKFDRKDVGANALVLVAAIVLDVVVLGAFLYVKATDDAMVIYASLVGLVVIVLGEGLFLHWKVDGQDAAPA